MPLTVFHLLSATAPNAVTNLHLCIITKLSLYFEFAIQCHLHINPLYLEMALPRLGVYKRPRLLLDIERLPILASDIKRPFGGSCSDWGLLRSKGTKKSFPGLLVSGEGNLSHVSTKFLLFVHQVVFHYLGCS